MKMARADLFRDIKLLIVVTSDWSVTMTNSATVYNVGCRYLHSEYISVKSKGSIRRSLRCLSFRLKDWVSSNNSCFLYQRCLQERTNTKALSSMSLSLMSPIHAEQPRTASRNKAKTRRLGYNVNTECLTQLPCICHSQFGPGTRSRTRYRRRPYAR